MSGSDERCRRPRRLEARTPLYGMKTMGLSATRGYRKCAKIVGEVMAISILTATLHYDTLGAGADFNTLPRSTASAIGSVDGDPSRRCATPRRGQSLADEMWRPRQEIVDFTPNYDETTEELTVLARAVPTSSSSRPQPSAWRQRPAAQPHRGRRRLHFIDREHIRRGRTTGTRAEIRNCSASSTRRTRPPVHHRPRRHRAGVTTGRGSIICAIGPKPASAATGVDRLHRDPYQSTRSCSNDW